MRFAYPCTLTPDEDGRPVVHFPDIPEALTDGADEAEALEEAHDCLVVALGYYVRTKRDLPSPSRTPPGGHLIPVPPVVAAKLALYLAMRDQGISQVALAERLGVTEGAVRKLVSLDHRSHIGQVETALRLLGRQLVVEDRAA